MSLSELLVYALIIAGVALFNYFMQQAAQKARREQARSEGEQRSEAAQANDASDYAWGSRPAAALPASTEETAPYEWGGRPEAADLPEVEYHGRGPLRSESALTREEFRARVGRSRITAEERFAARRRSLEKRPMFATREELRRAVIAMTVLGPCRAIEALEARNPGQSTPGSHRASAGAAGPPSWPGSSTRQARAGPPGSAHERG
jgi:hypothetical protein